jgi:hypothetical protein
MNEAVSEGEMGFSAQKSVECTAVVVIFNQPRKHVASYTIESIESIVDY